MKDMDLHETPGAANSMSVKRAWKLMQEHNAVTLPITDKEGKVEGLITTGDIAKSYMDAYDNTLLARQEHSTGVSRILWMDRSSWVMNMDTLSKEKWSWDCPSRIRWKALSMKTIWLFSKPCGGSAVCHRSQCKLSDRMSGSQSRKNDPETGRGEKSGDHFHTVRFLYRGPSDPPEYSDQVFYEKDNLVIFRSDDFTDKIKDIMTKTRYRAFPVVNTRGKYIGTVSRRNFMSIKKNS